MGLYLAVAFVFWLVTLASSLVHGEDLPKLLTNAIASTVLAAVWPVSMVVVLILHLTVTEED